MVQCTMAGLRLVRMSRIPSISHQLESAQNLTEGEKSDHLCCCNTEIGKLFSVQTSEASANEFRIKGTGCAGHQGRWLAKNIDDWLEVFLECSQTTVASVSLSRDRVT
jgi:hypothetical protein